MNAQLAAIDIVVIFVYFVMVCIPIRRFEVHFHIPGPQLPIDGNAGIEKIRSGVTVLYSYGFNQNRFIIRST